MITSGSGWPLLGGVGSEIGGVGITTLLAMRGFGATGGFGCCCCCSGVPSSAESDLW